MTTHLVISNYNADPRYLLNFTNSYTIFDSSDIKYFRSVVESIPGDIRFTENSGHNLLHFLDYIIENYDSLPSKLAFIKGNIVPRHGTLEFIESQLSKNFFSFLWNDPALRDKKDVQYLLKPGSFLEINNSWYVWDVPHRFFVSLDQFLEFIFDDYRHLEYVSFAPGGCYLLEASRIEINPLSFYEGIRKIVGYSIRPAEAFMLERALPLIFDRTHQLKSYCSDKNLFLQEIDKLPNLSNAKRIKAKLNFGNKIRWKLIEMLSKRIKVN